MKFLILMGILVLLTLQTACKVVNTHTVKITSSPQFNGSEVYIETTKGSVYLSTQSLSQKERNILQSLMPYQCLNITTAEPFNMQQRVVRFKEFKLKKLLQSESACRKVEPRNRMSISIKN